MSCIKKVQVDDTIYEAKIDFRTAIECNRIATDKTIGDFERVSGIICTMFGPEAVDNINHYEKLLKWALNYLSCGKEIKETKEQPDMDYIEDMDLIEASFMSDLGIDIETTELDWQKFNKYLNGLSNSELGNCCILNRIRNLRNLDLSKIKDDKERQRLKELKEEFALKKYSREYNLTKEQEESMENLNKILGL